MDGDASVGETIAGYVLEAPLGEGSTSRVFVGRHRTQGRRVALKVLAVSHMKSAEARLRLLEEARALSGLRHPHIAEVWSFHESTYPPRMALVMELVHGPSMRALRGQPLQPRAARTLALQLVDGVAAAHRAGVVHRDLKPDNILFTADPRLPEARLHLKIVDFGLAKRLGPDALFQTAAGAMLGTPAYMAPEQIMGRPAPSPATDIYAVAELVYELFTGERAFAEHASHRVLQSKVRGHVPELPMPGAFHRELQAVLRACLELEPPKRPELRAIEDVLEDLGDRTLSIPAGLTAIDDRTSKQSPTSPAEPEPRPSDRAAWEARHITDSLSAVSVRSGSAPQSSDLRTGRPEAEVPTEVRAPAQLGPPEREPTTSAELPVAESVLLGRREGTAPSPSPHPVLRPLDLRRPLESSGSSETEEAPVSEPPRMLDGEASTVSLWGSKGRPKHMRALRPLAILGFALALAVLAWVLNVFHRIPMPD